MGVHLPAIVFHVKQSLKSKVVHYDQSYHMKPPVDVPKGHFAVYVEENCKHRFVVPISYLKHPLFQDLLRRAEEEYGFDHATGGLTISCSKDAFLLVISHMNHYTTSEKFTD
ncbi:hypothetical protein RJ639_040103 [Escallonia herrerae]|uniref:Small auxin up regulated protein n=1 Tax=Escallonia herrerae TaxID=1293975 RepID=A0AA88WJS4_9ASTE|nr:hypothetical protein RJ639_040103 [Escallonia herrerae]